MRTGEFVSALWSAARSVSSGEIKQDKGHRAPWKSWSVGCMEIPKREERQHRPLIPFKRLWRQVDCADSREIREPRRSWRQLSAAVQVPGYGRLNGCGMEEAADDSREHQILAC